MRETDDDVVRQARIFVDTRAGAFGEAGDILQPLQAGVIGKDAVLGDLFDLAPRHGRRARIGRARSPCSSRSAPPSRISPLRSPFTGTAVRAHPDPASRRQPRCFFGRIAQLAPQHLADVGLRQLLLEDDVLGLLVAGQLLGAELQQRLLGQRRVLAWRRTASPLRPSARPARRPPRTRARRDGCATTSSISFG